MVSMILQRMTVKRVFGRTDRFVAGASSDISEEMIKCRF